MTTLVPTKKNVSSPSIFENFYNNVFLDMHTFFAFANQKRAFIPNVDVI